MYIRDHCVIPLMTSVHLDLFNQDVFNVITTDYSASPSVRLVGGANSLEGRVEIYHNNRWGTICRNYWDVNAATVLCRQLGYYGTASAARFGPGSVDQPIWLTKVNCTGEEDFITDCSHNAWGKQYCRHRGDAGVTCSGNKQLHAYYYHPLSLCNNYVVILHLSHPIIREQIDN